MGNPGPAVCAVRPFRSGLQTVHWSRRFARLPLTLPCAPDVRRIHGATASSDSCTRSAVRLENKAVGNSFSLPLIRNTSILPYR